MKCKGTCGRELVASSQWAALPAEDKDRLNATHARHDSRGLCGRCKHRARRAGTLADFERGQRTQDEVLDEWHRHADRARSKRHNIMALAPRLGMTPAALDRALCRAQAAGRLGPNGRAA